MSESEFAQDRVYDNVFLLFIDASGHSSIVANNPRDFVYQAMDLVHERLAGRLTTLANRHRCSRAKIWRWAGDGGFLVFHDEDESIARDTALEFIRKVLEIDLAHLRDEFVDLGIQGELHFRVAIHRGTIRYHGAGQEGFIYSPDINFVAQMEKAAPPNTALVSSDVYQVAGEFAASVAPVGLFHERPIYVYAPGLPPKRVAGLWLATRGLSDGDTVNALHERPSQREKARLIAAAESEVIDLGTALRTASHYLVTTERPTSFRDAVMELLRSGGRYVCVLMDPEAAATALVSEQRGEELPAKIKRSIADLERFRRQIGADGEGMEVWITAQYPSMACLTADIDAPHGLILMSPYLMQAPGMSPLERGDMPHYLLSRQSGRLYDNIRALVTGFARVDSKRVL